MASFSSLLGSYGPWITPKPLAHLRSQPFCALPSDSTKRFQVIKKKKTDENHIVVFKDRYNCSWRKVNKLNALREKKNTGNKGTW